MGAPKKRQKMQYLYKRLWKNCKWKKNLKTNKVVLHCPFKCKKKRKKKLLIPFVETELLTLHISYQTSLGCESSESLPEIDGGGDRNRAFYTILYRVDGGVLWTPWVEMYHFVCIVAGKRFSYCLNLFLK
jgi:hypothetical protein